MLCLISLVELCSAQCVADVLECEQHALQPFGCIEERLFKLRHKWLVVCSSWDNPSPKVLAK